MRLWHLYFLKSDDAGGYDEHQAFVVRAKSEAEARVIVEASINPADASTYHDSAPGLRWLDPNCTACVELTADGDAGIIICDFLEA